MRPIAFAGIKHPTKLVIAVHVWNSAIQLGMLVRAFRLELPTRWTQLGICIGMLGISAFGIYLAIIAERRQTMAKTRLTVMVRDDEKSKTKTIAQGDGVLIGTTQKLDGEVKVTISTTSLHPLEYLLLARQILDQAMTTCLEYENTLSDDPIRKRFQQMVANILEIDAEAEAAYEDNICVDEDIEPAKIIHFPEKK